MAYGVHASSESFFEKNRVVTSVSTVVGCLAITALVVGILAQTNVIPLLHSSWIPLVAGSCVVLTVDIVCLLGMVVRQKKGRTQSQSYTEEQQQQAARQQRPRGRPRVRTQHPPPPKAGTQGERVYSFSDSVLSPQDIEVMTGPGFPIVERDKREKVLAATGRQLAADWTDGENNYNQYKSYVKYKRCSDSEDAFFPKGDVLQTPVKMDYDHNFDPMTSRNYFYMHSSAAPKPGHYRNQAAYLDAMEQNYYNLLRAQVESGAHTLLTNYWGMGAFIRNYILYNYPDRKEAFNFRVRIAKRLANAFKRVVEENPDAPIRFNIGGPTGESFDDHLKQEPLDNYNAFVYAFGELPSNIRAKVRMCPETDIFVFGQQISENYQCQPGQLAPVSAINAGCSSLVGNQWLKGKRDDGTFNAEFAIEENVFRRSPVSAYWAAYLNGGYAGQPRKLSLWQQFSHGSAAGDES
ncbi:MAG: hypothetical protein S4CHLAM2_18690 [Chlamydiales bacterium]|nr:hypothetical protein [Chlamydiales bacterium]